MNEHCNNCGRATDWKEVYEREYGGAKGGTRRDETVCTVYRCKDCGAEGRRFEDGVDGTVTFTGAMR